MGKLSKRDRKHKTTQSCRQKSGKPAQRGVALDLLLSDELRAQYERWVVGSGGKVPRQVSTASS